MARRFALAGGVLLLLLPAELVFFYVRAYGVTTLHTDEWEHAPLVVALFEGRLRLADVTAQFNEHRIFVPRLVMLALDRLSRFDNKLWMYASWACACVTAAALAAAFSRRAELRGERALVAFSPVAWMVFSLRQFEAFLWGFEVQIFCCEMFCALAICFLCQRRLLLAAVAGLAATFSFAVGLLIWPVGAAHLLLDRSGARRLWAWCAASAIAIGWFFAGYRFYSSHADAWGWISHPGARISLLLVALGNPVAVSLSSASVLGGAALAVFAVLVALAIRGRIRAGPGASLALLGFLASALVAGARIEYGAAGVFNSRYAVFSGLFFAGAWMAAVEARLHLLAAAALAFVLWGQAGALGESFALGEARRGERRELAYIERTFAFQTDADVLQLYGDAAGLRARAAQLERLRLNVFATPLPDLRGAAVSDQRAGTLERAAPAVVSGQAPVDIEGWAADPENGNPVRELALEIDGRLFPVLYGYRRPEIAARLHSPDDALGFRAHLWLGPLGAGRHVLTVRALAGGKSYPILPARSVEVR